MKCGAVVMSSLACGALLATCAVFRAVLAQEESPAKAQSPAPGLTPSVLDQEIKRVEREVDRIEQQALAEWRALPITSSTRMNQVRILGKLLLFDKNLSVNKNEACSFCHMPDTDLYLFTM